MILAIDTSAGQCAVALVGARTVARAEPMARGHAEALMPMIDACMAEADARFSDLERVAICTGPGSFTGIRVGIAAARGIALGAGIPAIGISRFEAVAQGDGVVRLAGRAGTVFAQNIRGGLAHGAAWTEPGEAEDALADPVRIAALAAEREPGQGPSALYLRDADAALPQEGPPRLLD